MRDTYRVRHAVRDVGAALGAWLRWGLALWLNARVESLPLGTLAANLGGGFLIGLAVGVFSDWPQLSPER